MKHKELLIASWFAALVIYNFMSHWHELAQQNALALFLEAVGHLLSPVEVFLSVVVVACIALSGRKARTLR